MAEHATDQHRGERAHATGHTSWRGISQRRILVQSLAQVASFIRENDQTITYYGWERGEIELIAASRAGPGVSRWAPIGTALDFDFIWDGYDIPFELTRLVRVS